MDEDDWQWVVVRWKKDGMHQIRSDSQVILDWLSHSGEWEVLTPRMSLEEATAVWKLYPENKRYAIKI